MRSRETVAGSLLLLSHSAEKTQQPQPQQQQHTHTQNIEGVKWCKTKGNVDFEGTVDCHI